MQMGAFYQDNPTPYFVATEQIVNVLHSPGTASLSIPDSPTLGQPFYAYPTLLQASNINETFSQWTIDWGDGHSTVSPATPSHRYESGGTHTINATIATDEGTYTVSKPVNVTLPTISITQKLGGTAGVTSEGGAPDLLVLTRNLAGDQPVNVHFTLSGSADPSDYVLEDVNTGEIFTNSISVPGSGFCTVAVIAKDDQTPEWTESLALTLTPSTDYGVDPLHTIVTTNVADNDLGVSLFTGSGNINMLSSDDGSQDLFPLYLKIPDTVKDSTMLTLSVSKPDEVVVWPTSDPEANAEPLIDTPVTGSSYTFTPADLNNSTQCRN